MKRYKKFALLGLSAIAVISGLSCKRDKHPEKFIGPQYKNADPNFFVVDNAFSATPSSQVDLKKNQVTFSAKFSQEVTYFLRLTSKNGASILFTDQASDLSAVKWDGDHQGLYFFSAKDTVIAELSFLGSSIVKLDTIVIKTPKEYGKLVEDFEIPKPGHLSFPAGWYSFSGEAQGGGYSGAPDLTSILGSDGEAPGGYNGVVSYPSALGSVKPPSGKNYYRIRAKDANNDFYVDGAGFIGAQKLITANTDSVYFNMFVYGTGNSSDKGSIKIQEDDNGKGGVETNEDELFYDFKINWTGWKLVSVRYSDLSFTATITGNRIKEPKKAGKMGFVLLSDPSGGTTNLIFDYPIFTYGKPLPQN